ncbi:thiamine pyrophosphate-dependent dehydrogenase E1 component subunit alpha [Rhodococcus sp. JS3073]|uniref:thiamine pyrophosphate-dependent dehydrogenase E1 component subunit alpha n=1 Tax=Rhodococcus sp. JS3073 TaxID=3002901 RepID=UPI002285C9AB|nr:thiamine pyrophosphate-dependent dehydrogenase E1 component subunit alpha [Rhodococcus sp. JS3073]WAM19793.1 thiamine pyrophosphate-dependent dehydrogenase E1 component subunit alpha [Rhodococcus sp. JS3073]
MTEPLLAHYREMYRIRVLENEILRLRKIEEVVGSVHLCNGQEAIYVGAAAGLDLSRDAVFPTYRGHGWALALGATMHSILAELLGRSTGTNGGRGGSAYFSTPDTAMYGENSIVGAGAPIAAGAALAATFDGSGRVAVAAFGDGALNQGAVHEAMNFAAVQQLPIIFLVENNHYSEMTPIVDMVKNPVLFKRAAAYGITGARIDGNDPIVMRDAVSKATEHARAGKGPVLLEAMTHRIVGHYIGDAQQYRPAGEIDDIESDEPLARASRTLLQESGVTQTELDALVADVNDEVRAASLAALADPVADPTTVLEHLYA